MSSIKTTRFVRKPFIVEAVLVTADNMAAVAEWCNSPIWLTTKYAPDVKRGPEAGQTRVIKVRVLRPLNERQSLAFVGDYVVRAGTGFKVYTEKAFLKDFEEDLPKELFIIPPGHWEGHAWVPDVQDENVPTQQKQMGDADMDVSVFRSPEPVSTQDVAKIYNSEEDEALARLRENLNKPPKPHNI